ncbi:MAG: radical SAM family heme chaperone HemW [Trueperaceae bacterium]|nr:radical SAM family heme chaperone HemW [Trueperaceae bacterium]
MTPLVTPAAAPRSLYLHVPFCPQICPYCDFHKMKRHEGLVDAYLTRIAEEARAYYERFPGPLDTVYIGGGTPSHLNDAELARLIGAIDRTWGWPAQVETTLEADPLTFDAARLRHWRDLGISRLSIGVQSTQDDVLRFLGRQHGGRDGLDAVEMALAAGFEVSADLITAVPGQDAERDLHALAATGVPHISVYTLTIEPYTPFARRGVVVDETREEVDYERAREVLSGYGLERYEVSSHAKPGHASRHNQVYWFGDYFLALGPSAAGFLPSETDSDKDAVVGVRTTNGPIKTWLGGRAPERVTVDGPDFVLDMLMTGLRTARGVDLATLRARTGIDVAGHYQALIDEMVGRGRLVVEGSSLRATDAGLLQLNGILRRFFADPPAVLAPDASPGDVRSDAAVTSQP